MYQGRLSFSNNRVLSVQKTQHWYERLAGLLALPALKKGQGLLISPCNSVHTLGMKYALDLVYLNKQQEIIKLCENIVAQRFSGCWAAQAVLELPTGSIAQLQLTTGLSATWLPISATEG